MALMERQWRSSPVNRYACATLYLSTGDAAMERDMSKTHLTNFAGAQSRGAGAFSGGLYKTKTQTSRCGERLVEVDLGAGSALSFVCERLRMPRLSASSASVLCVRRIHWASMPWGKDAGCSRERARSRSSVRLRVLQRALLEIWAITSFESPCIEMSVIATARARCIPRITPL
jgi:hypothetical protein